MKKGELKGTVGINGGFIYKPDPKNVWPPERKEKEQIKKLSYQESIKSLENAKKRVMKRMRKLAERG